VEGLGIGEPNRLEGGSLNDWTVQLCLLPMEVLSIGELNRFEVGSLNDLVVQLDSLPMK
jgi:hypothetical protein